MEPANFANRHDELGIGDHSSISNQTSRRPHDITNDTVGSGPTPREDIGARDFAHNPGAVASSTSSQARANISGATEIGDPHGRIPTAQDTHDQRNAAHSQLDATGKNELPGGSSYAGHAGQGVSQVPSGDPSTGISTSQRGHRNSNYAPGYEGAADAVRQRSYNEDEHRPSLLAHEPVTPLTEVPPDLGNNAQHNAQHNAPTSGPGMIPGPSIGQKAKAPFAKIHGAGEVLRGNIAAAADSLTGDKAKQAESEEIVKKGQREFTEGRFDRAQTSRVEH
ncbi:hypothetical protein Daus18300_007479 [Diaporthe australafricana]|uniref:Uncharacterized protein n=1 Tax=Diaporthe australafricana TaxID=127596 RepID=A0ABR3WN94_9PEZI